MGKYFEFGTTVKKLNSDITGFVTGRTELSDEETTYRIEYTDIAGDRVVEWVKVDEIDYVNEYVPSPAAEAALDAVASAVEPGEIAPVSDETEAAANAGEPETAPNETPEEVKTPESE